MLYLLRAVVFITLEVIPQVLSSEKMHHPEVQGLALQSLCR